MNWITPTAAFLGILPFDQRRDFSRLRYYQGDAALKRLGADRDGMASLTTGMNTILTAVTTAVGG
jgi:hypothetical protein